MRQEQIDQLAVRAAPLDPVTVTDHHNTLHCPFPKDTRSESGPRPLKGVGPQPGWACPRFEGRLTGTRLIHEQPVGVKCSVTRGFFASQARASACLRVA